MNIDIKRREHDESRQEDDHRQQADDQTQIKFDAATNFDRWANQAFDSVIPAAPKAQSMTEYEIVKTISSFTDPEMEKNAKIAKLLSFSSYLLNINVGRYIMANPAVIDDVLFEAMRMGKLSDDQFVGLAFAALMAGGRHWDTLARIVHHKPERPELVKRLQGHL